MNGDEADVLLVAIRQGDRGAMGQLLQLSYSRLCRIVSLRMDRRLRGRLDPADVVQEACLVADQRIGDYWPLSEKMPFFVWLRFLTLQSLAQAQRKHLGAAARDVRQEITCSGPITGDTSVQLAARLLGHQTTPSQAAVRRELSTQFQAAIDSLEPIDRQVLVLRHYEQLNNREAAEVMQIEPSAASNRHVRALNRLRTTLQRKFPSDFQTS